MAGIDEGLVAAALAGDILAGLALIGSGGGVHAYRGQGLGGIVAGGHGVVARADGVLAGGDVVKGDVLDVGAFLGDHDQVVLEHVDAGGRVDVALLHGSVHGALRGADQQIGVGAGAQHLVKLAGCLVLRVGEGHVVMAVGGVGGLNLFHCLGQGVGREYLQLDLLLVVVGGLFGGRIVLLLGGAAVGRAAGQSEGAHHRERAYGRDHDAKLLLHVFPFFCDEITPFVRNGE